MRLINSQLAKYTKLWPVKCAHLKHRNIIAAVSLLDTNGSRTFIGANGIRSVPLFLAVLAKMPFNLANLALNLAYAY